MKIPFIYAGLFLSSLSDGTFGKFRFVFFRNVRGFCGNHAHRTGLVDVFCQFLGFQKDVRYFGVFRFLRHITACAFIREEMVFQFKGHQERLQFFLKGLSVKLKIKADFRFLKIRTHAPTLVSPGLALAAEIFRVPGYHVENLYQQVFLDVAVISKPVFVQSVFLKCFLVYVVFFNSFW